ncbi:MAG: nonstructural protein [Microviridae sp.]|nr:MAG: nonstructural protein [Microviridae sp.]
MKYVYSVFDKKAGVYCTPFVSHSDATATRDFRQAVNDPSTQVCKYASDFELFCLGAWDEDVGSLQPTASPVFVVNGMSLQEAS